ncbi:hypothetical protein M9Y10_002999 [Tritrichomonas musculus]|uniref:Lecithin:cholesterol acyltransferase family protein n=1 Tax=Tritrichomonas musculus TaxID=1915356 RepID=A0ABR2LBE6_9EUKA
MLFLFTLTFLVGPISYKKPVILLPGLYGSSLYVSYNEKAHVPWYCPKRMDDELLWIRTKFLIPPFLNCMALLTQLTFDNETQQVHNLEGVNITVKDFGGRSSVDYVIKNLGKFIPSHHGHKTGKLTFFDNFGSMIDYFEDRGYEVGKNFFVAPYDWRRAPLFIDDYWIQLRQLIEKIYDNSNGQKVTLLGFSMGCFMIQQFLAGRQLIINNKSKNIDGRPIWTSIKDKNLTVSDSWKKKYIEKVVFLAPSFGGSIKAFDGMIRRFSPLVPFYRTEYIADMSTSIPGFFSHWPNLEIFKGDTVVRGPDGQNYTVEQLRDLVYDHSNIKKDYVPIMDISIDLQRKAPIDIGENIPLTIIYNSKIPTTNFLDYRYGWNHDPIRILNGSGDGSLPAKGIRYVCDHWKTIKRAMVCIDLGKNDYRHFKHGRLTIQPIVLDLIYNATVGNPENGNQQWWMKKGKTEIYLGQHHSN